MVPNKIYIISCYGEEELTAKYIKEERGFYIFEIEGRTVHVRKHFVKTIGLASIYNHS